MITAVAFCPQAPVLVPELAQGAAPELDELRAACRTAIRTATAAGGRLVLAGAGPGARAFGPAARGTLAGFGLPLEIPLGADAPGAVELPPSLTVGAWLVRDALGADSGAVAVSVPDGQGMPELPDAPCALVVLGDGSARRSEKAPGYFDPRAAELDAALARSLATGDPAGLAAEHLATYGARDLLVGGLTVWTAVAPLLAGAVWDAELLYDAAPYGVGYFVAAWTRRG
ncbi:MAG TPA: hypothetical protein VFH38_07005 [Jatrophihabitans sp.]|nr:hypothetical protein [Jatrophihabitans sp.]